MFAAFSAVAATRRDWRVLLAGWAWVTGFETAYQITMVALGQPLLFGWPASVLYMIPGLVTVPWTLRQGIRPSLPLMAGVCVLWAVWIAFGFHSNHNGMAGFDAGAEALNDAAKTLWAVAYLLPFLATRKAPPPVRAGLPGGVVEPTG